MHNGFRDYDDNGICPVVAPAFEDTAPSSTPLIDIITLPGNLTDSNNNIIESFFIEAINNSTIEFSGSNEGPTIGASGVIYPSPGSDRPQRGIRIARMLNVLAGDRIIVPGTEPSTTISSTSLEAQMLGGGLPMVSIISLADALKAIPGSSIQLLSNYGAPIQKLFVLPESDIDNPSTSDYFLMLREAARPADDDDVAELANRGFFDDISKLYGG